MKPIIPKSKILFLAALLTHSAVYSWGDNDLELGKKYYSERISSVAPFACKKENVDLSIEFFEKALRNSKTEEEAGQHLLWAYFFKAMFICEEKDEKKEFFGKGKDLGEKLTEEYPNNLDLKFGYAVNTGKWSEVNGVFASACDGVASKIKNTVEQAMNIDPTYNEGLGYRLLGILYFKAPYIPILLPWADKKEGLEKAKYAAINWPKSIGNQLTLGELLYWSESHEEAKKVFTDMQKLKPRSENYTLDQYELKKAQNYIKEIDSYLARPGAN